MKKCICCGTESASESRTCAHCGEGSWTVEIPELEIEPSDKPIGSDPDTAVEIPARRRRTR